MELFTNPGGQAAWMATVTDAASGFFQVHFGATEIEALSNLADVIRTETQDTLVRDEALAKIEERMKVLKETDRT